MTRPVTTYCSVGVFQISRKALNATNHRNPYHPIRYYSERVRAFSLSLSTLLCLEISLVCRKYLAFAKKKKNRELFQCYANLEHTHTVALSELFLLRMSFSFWKYSSIQVDRHVCVLYSWQMMNWTKFLHIHHIDILICEKKARRKKTHDTRERKKNANTRNAQWK